MNFNENLEKSMNLMKTNDFHEILMKKQSKSMNFNENQQNDTFKTNSTTHPGTMGV